MSPLKPCRMKAACDEIIATAVRRDIGSVSKVRARNLETALALVMMDDVEGKENGI